MTACKVSFAKASAKLHVATGALTSTSDHLKRHSSNVGAAGTVVQEPMKHNFWNYIQMVFDQVKQSSEAYQSNVEDICSLVTAFMQNIGSMYA